MDTSKVRVRFAPSPTGPLHMGGVRTALFNYLFAKKNDGIFILRIEDTDQTRYVPGTEEYIIESLKWCGIPADEGYGTTGEFGPYKQSERKDLYKKYAQQLIDSGNAYYAFDTPGDLEKMREDLSQKGVATPQYDSKIRLSMKNSLSLSNEEVKELLKSETPFVIRFKMPDNEIVEIKDIIRGDIKVNTSTLDDKVIFKSDGLPTYHLANIVDDYHMKISHVIRGEEWLPSTPLHVLLYRALGWENQRPVFAHLPLILKPAGKGKLSKRDGDKLGFPVFPLEWKDPQSGEISLGYKESGYLPEAFVNMLAFLGWNPGTEEEVFSLEQLIANFSLERVGKAGARFDPEKAKWFNHQHLQLKPLDMLAKDFREILQEKNIGAELPFIEKVVSMVKERATFIMDIWEQSYYFFQAPEAYDAKAVKKRWKESTPDIMLQIKIKFEALNDFNSESIENETKSFIQDNELGMGAVLNALRLCIVGNTIGPHLFDIIEMIGKDEAIDRIQKAVDTIKK